MFTKHANQEVGTIIIFHWILLSVCAGFINAIAFVGLGTFATHVTGFATLFGVHLSQSDSHSGNATAALAVPLFFLAGAIVSGLCVEERVRQKKAPHYDYVMYACAGLLVIACFVGDVRNVAPTQTYLEMHRNFVLLSLLCLASGLMNAALSYSSKASVRITHLTGVTTDLGLGLARVLSLRVHGEPVSREETQPNLLRALTVVAFIVGGLGGAFLYRAFRFNALLAPAAYLVYVGHRGKSFRSYFRFPIRAKEA